MRGYKEEGTTTTPFDMTVLNDLDRFHLAMRRDRPRAAPAATSRRTSKQDLRNKLIEHKLYIARARRRHAGDPRLEVAVLMQPGGTGFSLWDT